MPLIKGLLDGLIRTVRYPVANGPFGSGKIFSPYTAHPLDEPGRFGKSFSGYLLINKSSVNDILAIHVTKLQAASDNPMSAGNSIHVVSMVCHFVTI